jgi:hypothetical protein
MTGPQNAGDYPAYGTPPAQPGQPSQYGRPQYQQPQYQQPQYQQPQYEQPQYEQPQYQHPYGGHPAHVYPPQPPGASAPRVALQWSGALMFLGGAILAVGAFLDWAKVTLGARHISITGLGSLSGDDQFKQFVSPSKVTDGKITLTFGILLIVGAIIILAHQGRVWVGIVGTVLSAICLIIGLADIGQASNANDTYKSDNIPAHLSVQIGLVLTLVGAIVALAFSIVAICVRRRQV